MLHSCDQPSEARLFYGTPEIEADLLAFGGFMAPDPFFAFAWQGRRIAFLSALEIGRGRREGGFDEVFDIADLRESAEERLPVAEQILRACRKLDIRHLLTPPSLPAAIALPLHAQSTVRVRAGEEPYYAPRLHKSPAEAEAIRAVNRICSLCFKRVEEILAAASIAQDELIFEGETLTSERLHREIRALALDHDALARDPIVAGGDQACDPHERGSGPLRPHELIIVDIFPRDLHSGFFGDMTRTYLRGNASAEQRKLVHSVREAQLRALAKIRPGCNGRDVHAAAADFFEECGYRTGQRNGGYEGFFHGTGHGLGLEIHEAPRISKVDETLAPGLVFTVEPGLYYPGLGGCRIEDVVWMKDDGFELLSGHSYEWHFA